MYVIRGRSANFRPLKVNKDYFRILVAAIFGIVASFTPWPNIVIELSGAPMWDRSVYISSIESGKTVLSYISFDNLLSYFLFEFLWARLLNFISYSPYLHYETLFQIISTFSLLTFAIILAQRTHFFALIFLLNPLIIDLIYSQLRLSLAISILMWLIILRIRAWYIFLPFAAFVTAIHTSMVIFVAVHFVALVTAPGALRYGLSPQTRITMLVLFGFSVGILVGPLRELILSVLGDRRADYPSASSSLVYLSYWIVLFISLVVDQSRTLKSYESRYAVAILGIIFINMFTGFYSSRFIAALLPFLIVSSFSVFGKYNFFVSLPFLFYVVLQWLYYINNLTS